MESKPSLSVSPSSRGDTSRPGLPADWQPSSGIVDRMLAYREWWNIPEGVAGRGAARTGASKNRIRPQDRAG
ncbi:MAG: hypothetical protein JF616_19085 [Fibrobacteres bacterium]|nr:hypothetical protein [Fibrobacterota bacterium]